MSSAEILRPELKAKRLAENGECELDFFCSDALSCFRGHFPGLPIVPAYVQLEWVRQFALEALPVQGELTQCKRTKFLLPLTPNRNYTLRLRLSATQQGLVEFFIFDEQEPRQTCSKGSFHFERLT